MKTTMDWIEIATKQLGVTDYRLAKLIDMDRSLLSAYRNGRQILSEGHAIKLGELLGIDPMPIVASAAYERSKSEHIKSFWAKHAETVGAFTIGTLVAGTILTAPAPANAAGTRAISSDNAVYYVNYLT
jgi:transcriptional regulator with XRE-family HTH domain